MEGRQPADPKDYGEELHGDMHEDDGQLLEDEQIMQHHQEQFQMQEGQYYVSKLRLAHLSR